MKGNRTRYYYSPLARRIGIYVIVVSACITLFTSGLQIYSEYKRDVSGVQQRLDQLETTQLTNIASRVWVLDTLELERTLKSLLELQSIEFVAVYDYDTLLMSVGKDFDKNAVVVKHRLKYQHNNKTFDIGSIVIKASLDEVYSLIFDRAVVIVISNAFKTFIVAGFILFIFYHLVARHLLKIARHTKIKDFLSEDVNLELDRKNNDQETDELDSVVGSINSLRTELLAQFTEIKNQQQYLSLTLESIGDAVVTIGLDGRIIRMNAVAEKLTGWSFAEAKGCSINSIFHVIDYDTFEPVANIQEMIKRTEQIIRVENETVLFSRSGQEYHISYLATPIKDAENNTLGIVLIFRDTTREHALREDIAKNKRDMQAIMNNTPAIIYIKNIDGKYIFINKRYETLFDITLDSITGKTDYEIFNKDIADILKRNDDNVKRAGQPLELEEQVPLPHGEVRTYISIKFPLYDDTNNIYAICGISTDITERKMQENHFRRAQKMDALGKLTSGIAHDYNNMLGIIVGYAQLLEATLTENPTLQKYAKEIHHAGDRGAKLTKKLLDFSSRDSADAEIFNINSIIKEEQHMLEKTLTPRINLQLELQEDLWIVKLDEGELEDALINISINAMHAMEGDGVLTIKTCNKTLDAREAERLHIDSGDYAVLSISDTGCGMDEETREKIFDPFYSTKGSKGTGLGLSQVYGFMERSSGAIDVITNPGQGSHFDLYFPRSRDFEEHFEEQQPLTRTTVQTGRETVLVVDDEPSLVNLINENLGMHGYNVLTANNGGEALNILSDKQVDLLISDIIMPKVDGVKLATEVKKLYPDIKIQMVSGYADNKLDTGIDGKLAREILYKPFSMQELVRRVRGLLDEKNDNNKLSGRLVLVMDDIEDVRELFTIHLERLGCEVITVTDGEEAINVYKDALNNGNPIDIAILDLTIPGGLNGNEIAKQIRTLNSATKIILASGFFDDSIENLYEADNFDGVIEKDFNAGVLKQALEQILS